MYRTDSHGTVIIEAASSGAYRTRRARRGSAAPSGRTITRAGSSTSPCAALDASASASASLMHRHKHRRLGRVTADHAYRSGASAGDHRLRQVQRFRSGNDLTRVDSPDPLASAHGHSLASFLNGWVRPLGGVEEDHRRTLTSCVAAVRSFVRNRQAKAIPKYTAGQTWTLKMSPRSL